MTLDGKTRKETLKDLYWMVLVIIMLFFKYCKKEIKKRYKIIIAVLMVLIIVIPTIAFLVPKNATNDRIITTGGERLGFVGLKNADIGDVGNITFVFTDGWKEIETSTIWLKQEQKDTWGIKNASFLMNYAGALRIYRDSVGKNESTNFTIMIRNDDTNEFFPVEFRLLSLNTTQYENMKQRYVEDLISPPGDYLFIIGEASTS